MTDPIYILESEGVEKLKLLTIPDTQAEQEYLELTRLAAQICNVPFSAISLIESERQWFLAKVGLKINHASCDTAFSAHTILGTDLFIVTDAAKDERFALNPFVTDEPGIRFYAGAPLITDDGFPLGTLFVADRNPRELMSEQKEALQFIARQIMRLLDLRRQTQKLAEINDKLNREIAERVSLEKILRLHDQSIASISEGILITEIQPHDNVIVFANAGFESLTGYNIDEIRGLNCRFMQGPETNYETVDVMRKAIQDEKFCAVEILNYRKDGTPFWNALSISPIKDNNGKLTHFVGVQQDITDRKNSEKKLQRSEERYRFLSEFVPQQIWTASPDGQIRYGNRRTVEYFGNQTIEELSGLNWTRVLHPDDIETVLEGWMNSVKTCKNYESEHRLRRSDGDFRWHLAQAVPIFDENGKITKWFGTNIDIHDRKMAEKAARETAEYRNLFQNANDAILIFDADSEIVLDVNEKACRMYGFDRSEFIGKSIKEISKDVGRGELQIKQLLENGSQQSFESTQFCSDGSPIDLYINSSIIEYHGRKVVLSINRDITERKRTEAKLLESQNRYRQLFDSNPHPLWVYEVGTFEFLAVNEAAVGSYGFSREEFLKMTLKDLFPPDQVSGLIEQTYSYRFFDSTFTCEAKHRKKDGTTIDAEITSHPIDFSGKNARLVTSTDITERLKAEEQLRQNALHDALTGLPNRNLFLEHLRHAIESSNRNKKLFAVLFLDFDHFKIINDSLGHMEGDNLLRLIAKRLIGSMRSNDIVARLGGDEFTILLDNVTGTDDVLQIVEHIQSALKSPFVLRDNEVFITASIGVTLSTENYTKPEAMLRDADIAMYRAKAAGKAGYQIFDPAMHEQVNLRLQVETELRQALKHEEFCIHYQPIINLETGLIIGFESLIRWQHPRRGLVYPGDFISIAEETGLIVPIGEWALLESCRQLREWQDEFDKNLLMSVNLSCRQFVQKNLVERVTEILSEMQVEPESLRLEITESYLMEDTEAAIKVLNSLRSAGIKLSIDDFGTGYSSLSYLHRLPIDCLKIDRSFVSRMQDNSENREIVRTIILLAKNLNLEVVAEGIETIEQVEYLKSLDCHIGQGFFYAKPVAATLAREFILNNFAINNFELVYNFPNHTQKIEQL